jgi:hypothetical protein
VDLKLSMNQSFVPKVKGVNTHDDRELGLLVYHLYVSEADKLGSVTNIVDAGPVSAPTALAAASPAPTAPARRAPAARPVSQTTTPAPNPKPQS